MKGIAMIAAALLVLVLPGCGGDEAEEPAAPSGKPIEIALSDFKLDPETVRVETAGTYTFRAVNNGKTEHALEVEGEGLEEETEEFGPGESRELTIELEKGQYELYCPVDGHKDRGMEGEITVGGDVNGTDDDTTETETEAETTETEEND